MPKDTSMQAYGDSNERDREAAEAGEPTKEERVLMFVGPQESHGATTHETAAAINMPLQTCSGTITKLVQAGKMKDSGKRRLTPNLSYATVWICCDEEEAKYRRFHCVIPKTAFTHLERMAVGTEYTPQELAAELLLIQLRQNYLTSGGE